MWLFAGPVYHAVVPLGSNVVHDYGCLFTIVLKPGDASGWASNYCFQWRVSYADLDRSSCVICSMVREASAVGPIISKANLGLLSINHYEVIFEGLSFSFCSNNLMFLVEQISI